MNYKILLIFAMTAATTLYLAINNSSKAFTINENSVNNLPITTSSFALNADNNSSAFNDNQNYNITNNLKDTSQKQQNNLLITKLLAKNLENRIQKAGAILEITSKLPQVRNVPFANMLNQTLNTLHGIPQNADIEKRQVAKDIIDSNNDFRYVIFIMPNGDIYFEEPYSRQQTLTTSNLTFRDYFKTVIKTNDIYLGNMVTTLATPIIKTAVIALPVYSLKDNSTIVGVWTGGIDVGILNKEIQSFNFIRSLDNNTRVVYVDNIGQKVADSDAKKSKMPESFTNHQSFKNAINGQSGSIVDTVDNKKMMVTYQPINAFHNTWSVLLIQSINSTVN